MKIASFDSRFLEAIIFDHWDRDIIYLEKI